MLTWLRRLWCTIAGHHWPMNFRQGGVYWCDSAGPYDCVCTRCGARWEDTPAGALALARSLERDPREDDEVDACLQVDIVKADRSLFALREFDLPMRGNR